MYKPYKCEKCQENAMEFFSHGKLLCDVCYLVEKELTDFKIISEPFDFDDPDSFI